MGFSFFSFFVAGIFVSLMTAPPPKKDVYVTKKTDKIGNGLAGVHTTRVPNFRVYISKKRRGHWMLNRFGVIRFNQPIPHTKKRAVETYYTSLLDPVKQVHDQGMPGLTLTTTTKSIPH